LTEHSDFHELSPDAVLNCVESVLDTRCTSICRPLTSYINRVYEVETNDGEHLVAKFYRPGRWSREAVQDEHDFLLELADHEVPVIPPLVNIHGETLAAEGDMLFALFERKGGRTFEDPDAELWGELGRLLARMHNIGDEAEPVDRITWTPDIATQKHLNYILENDAIDDTRIRARYEEMVQRLIDEIDPMFDDRTITRIHGDCHANNIIYRPGERFYLIDFDDMAVGPPAQDVWMLLPGYRSEVQKELDWFLDGYETFREFDYPSLQLIEPLRAMRFIHFTAWCVRQSADGGYNRLDPDFGTDAYWHTEIRDLENQIERIQIEAQSSTFPR
jgi:Ser/Thr protein kinase RdoA (MazF antagonist)